MDRKKGKINNTIGYGNKHKNTIKKVGKMDEYDIAVIGAGPAGLMAATYAGRYKLSTVVFGEIFGGTITEAHEVCNFPGYCNITGFALSQKMVEQVNSLGIEIVPDRIASVKKVEGGFILKGTEKEIKAKKVIVAIGTKRKHLGLARELELRGKGVSYCATCDGPFFKNKIVGVIGGSDAALSSASYLADIAQKVYIIYRKGEFSKAEPVWLELVNQNNKIEKVFNSNVIEFMGNDRLTGVKLDTKREIMLDGVFIEIGSAPQKDFLNGIGLALDEWGYVVVDKKMRTNIHGVFSAGDLNSENFKQAVVATAEGAIAANTAFEEIKRESVKER